MTTGAAFSATALDYFAQHAVDAALAGRLGVREQNECLVFPGGRRRSLNGVEPKVKQPPGRPLTPWTLVAPERPAVALVCEGESDALAAASALEAMPADAPLGPVAVMSVPGTGCPTGRVVEAVAALEPGEVAVAFDGDDAGRREGGKLVAKLREARIASYIVEMPDGRDLADCLAGEPEEERVRWLASALLDYSARESARPAGGEASSRDPRSDERGTDAMLGEVPAYPTDALHAAARTLVRCGQESGLPAALVGGAALAATAAAIGPRAELEVTPTWSERAILWPALLAPRGAGKSPAQGLAFGPLRELDAAEDFLLGDQTLEALARSLAAIEGAALDLDELAVLLRGLGEYKRAGGGDRGRFLALWTGAPWSFVRVGSGGKRHNGVKLRIVTPTLVVCGGLQTVKHELLGSEDDGLRPRWLPHLATLPAEVGALGSARPPGDWDALLLDHLNARRGQARTWHLDERGRGAFAHYRTQWKRQARHAAEAASTAAGLDKADIHLARVALVLAEAQAAGHGGPVGAELVTRAAAIVDFTLGCWRALPEQGALALSRRDATLDRAIGRLVAWLEERGGKASRRELQRACVAGARTAADLDALLGRYEATFPGTVTTESPRRGGLPTEVVRAPPQDHAYPSVGICRHRGKRCRNPVL